MIYWGWGVGGTHVVKDTWASAKQFGRMERGLLPHLGNTRFPKGIGLVEISSYDGGLGRSFHEIKF